MIAFILTQIKSEIPAPATADLEKQLIAGLRNHELSAFNQLYKMYSATLFGVIMKVVNQQETAEDLLQEAFLKIRRYIGSYDEKKSRLFTWMLNISRNTAIDHLRLKSSRQMRSNQLFEDVEKELDNHSHSFNTDTVGVKKLLEGLLPKHKQMIDLFYYKGYTHSEIAELLEMPLGSVKTAIRQAILNLRMVFDVK